MHLLTIPLRAADHDDSGGGADRVTKAHVTGASALAPPWRLKLYIAGATPRSVRALANLEAICERHLAVGYSIEVIDLFESPARAREDQIVAIPTLVRESPPPPRRVIGDLGDEARVLLGLQISSLEDPR